MGGRWVHASVRTRSLALERLDDLRHLNVHLGKTRTAESGAQARLTQIHAGVPLPRAETDGRVRGSLSGCAWAPAPSGGRHRCPSADTERTRRQAALSPSRKRTLSNTSIHPSAALQSDPESHKRGLMRGKGEQEGEGSTRLALRPRAQLDHLRHPHRPPAARGALARVRLVTELLVQARLGGQAQRTAGGHPHPQSSSRRALCSVAYPPLSHPDTPFKRRPGSERKAPDAEKEEASVASRAPVAHLAEGVPARHGQGLRQHALAQAAPELLHELLPQVLRAPLALRRRSTTAREHPPQFSQTHERRFVFWKPLSGPLGSRAIGFRPGPVPRRSALVGPGVAGTRRGRRSAAGVLQAALGEKGWAGLVARSAPGRPRSSSGSQAARGSTPTSAGPNPHTHTHARSKAPSEPRPSSLHPTDNLLRPDLIRRARCGQCGQCGQCGRMRMQSAECTRRRTPVAASKSQAGPGPFPARSNRSFTPALAPPLLSSSSSGSGRGLSPCSAVEEWGEREEAVRKPAAAQCGGAGRSGEGRSEGCERGERGKEGVPSVAQGAASLSTRTKRYLRSGGARIESLQTQRHTHRGLDSTQK